MKRNEVIETSLTDLDAKNLLATKTGDSFAADLCAKYPKLSVEQLFWLHKKALEMSAPKPKGIEVGNFQRIHTMFHRAAKHLKYPKINLMDDEGHCVILSLAPIDGKNVGCVYVKDGNKNYMGKVTAAGEFFPSRMAPATLVPYLRKFAGNPEQIAAKYGKLTGNCCFCLRSLSDERSTDVGYGPVCADRYGLAWGSRQPKH